MTPIIAIDPGYRQSAFIRYEDRICEHGIVDNAYMVEYLEKCHTDRPSPVLVIEEMQLFSSSFGVGKEVFDSVFWSGIFVKAWMPRKWTRILRSKIRGHLHASKGGDSVVRAALIARFGPFKEDAVGTKKKPGPLYGIKADEWSALAIAVTYQDLFANLPEEVRPGVVPEF